MFKFRWTASSSTAGAKTIVAAHFGDQSLSALCLAMPTPKADKYSDFCRYGDKADTLVVLEFTLDFLCGVCGTVGEVGSP